MEKLNITDLACNKRLFRLSFMDCIACSISNLPKRNYQPAVTCSANFDVAVRNFGAKTDRCFLKEGLGWYNLFGISLGSRRFAVICQWETFPDTIEISLELVRDLFFYEDDLLEILAVLEVEVKDTARQGAFKWKTKKN